MIQLVKELIQPLLEEENKVVGIFGGGFKPPIKGHLAIVQKALETNPDLDKLIVSVGSGVRDGIDQSKSLAVWDVYRPYLPSNVEIGASTTGMPIKDIYRLAKENPNTKVYWFIGAREGREDDQQDIAARTKSADKYPNLEVKVITTSDPNVSGTNARKALKAKDKEAFISFLPEMLSDEEKNKIYNILVPSINENASYSKEINIREKIDQLTQHMIDKGMNIEPLPSLEFVNGDTENARDFFGKTAYYDPKPTNHCPIY